MCGDEWRTMELGSTDPVVRGAAALANGVGLGVAGEQLWGCGFSFMRARAQGTLPLRRPWALQGGFAQTAHNAGRREEGDGTNMWVLPGIERDEGGRDNGCPDASWLPQKRIEGRRVGRRREVGPVGRKEEEGEGLRPSSFY